jgi:hypothetical protein
MQLTAARHFSLRNHQSLHLGRRRLAGQLCVVHRTKANYDLAKVVLGSFDAMAEKVVLINSDTLPVILNGLLKIVKAFPDMAVMGDERIEGMKHSLPSACQIPLIDVALQTIVKYLMAGPLNEEDVSAIEEEYGE